MKPALRVVGASEYTHVNNSIPQIANSGCTLMGTGCILQLAEFVALWEFQTGKHRSADGSPSKGSEMESNKLNINKKHGRRCTHRIAGHVQAAATVTEATAVERCCVLSVVGVGVAGAIDRQQTVSQSQICVRVESIRGCWVGGGYVLGLVLWPLHKVPCCDLHTGHMWLERCTKK